MATFVDQQVTWDGTLLVHLVSNVVWERSSKFTNCGKKIGPNPRYEGERGKSSYMFEPFIVSCPDCTRKEE